MNSKINKTALSVSKVWLGLWSAILVYGIVTMMNDTSLSLIVQVLTIVMISTIATIPYAVLKFINHNKVKEHQIQ